MKERYLYYHVIYGKETFRSKVTRETKHTIWIDDGNNTEVRISKKTYTVGSGWHSTHYYEETPELYQKWRSSRLRRVFHAKLKRLEKCKDESIMAQVIAIEVPEGAIQ